MLQIAATSPAYTDRDRFELTVLPTFVNHDVGNVKTSVTSVGKLGFSVAAGGTGADGIGFAYKTSPNLLYEGGLLLGTGLAKISDAARGSLPTVSDDDFATVTGGVPAMQQPGPWAAQQTVATFNDSLAVVAAAGPRASGHLRLRRPGARRLRHPALHDSQYRRHGAHGLRAGWFCDWDIDGGTYDTNMTGFDAARNLGYVYDTGSGPTLYIGTRVLNAAGATSCRGITNDQAFAPDWGVYDGFSDTEKWEALSGGVVHPAAGPTDISLLLATGPFTVAAGDSVEVGFAFLGGDDLAALRVNADAAALKWEHLHSGVPVSAVRPGRGARGRGRPPALADG